MINFIALYIKRKKHKEFKKFIVAQTHAMNKAKHIESEKTCGNQSLNDNGNHPQEFYFWWIQSYSESFRDAWKKSICRHCKHVWTCSDCIKDKCSHFSPDDFLTKIISILKQSSRIFNTQKNFLKTN